MANRISVVVSQGQSHHPAKRQLEEEIVGQLLTERAVEVTVIPNLYDLTADGSAILCLQGIADPMIVLAWMYPRAIRWILSRNGIRGKEGITLLDEESEEDGAEEIDGDSADRTADENADKRVTESLELPDRKIYCLNLSTESDPDVFVKEIKRIASEAQVKTIDSIDWLSGNPKPQHVERMLQPLPGNIEHRAGGNGVVDNSTDDAPTVIEEPTERRWYPVIDMSRCTNCMECIDFCLFGVYGIDQVDTILVEQPDNCRKGCPACSRVCPENAILFPQHKTPAIAGSNEVAAAIKVDLSKLFGAPEAEAVDVAIRERDEQLLLVGRDIVGDTVGVSREKSVAQEEAPDALDQLIDQLDALDL